MIDTRTRVIRLTVLIAVLLCIAGCLPKGHSYVEGLYLKSANDSDMIIIDDYGPCVMRADNNKVNFDNLTDGDRIKVEVAQIAESYPMQADVYSLKKLSDGEIGDIDPDILASLKETGWIAD